jgi:hypothetical protein
MEKGIRPQGVMRFGGSQYPHRHPKFVGSPRNDHASGRIHSANNHFRSTTPPRRLTRKNIEASKGDERALSLIRALSRPSLTAVRDMLPPAMRFWLAATAAPDGRVSGKPPSLPGKVNDDGVDDPNRSSVQAGSGELPLSDCF